jgi:hypothetical protein
MGSVGGKLVQVVVDGQELPNCVRMTGTVRRILVRDVNVLD